MGKERRERKGRKRRAERKGGKRRAGKERRKRKAAKEGREMKGGNVSGFDVSPHFLSQQLIRDAASALPRRRSLVGF